MSHDVRIPVFSRPFRLVPVHGEFAVCEQDSEEDILTCVAVLLETVIGQRVDLVNYGISDMLFSVDLDTNDILARIAEWEPRALTIIEEDIDRLDQLIRTLRVTVGIEGS